MGGYLLIFAYYAIIFPQILHFGIPVWFIEQFFGVLVNISASSQAPILYFTRQFKCQNISQKNINTF
jgi:hypothetical protein